VQTPTYASRGAVVRYPSDGDTKLVIGFKGQGRDKARDRMALLAFKEVLGGGPVDPHTPGRSDNRASRLARNVLEKNSNIGVAYAFHDCYPDAGIFGLYAEANAGNGEKLLKSVLQEVKATSDELSSDDVVRAKNVLKGNSARKLAGRRALANQLAASTFAGATQTIADIAALIDSLSLDDIKRAGQAALNSAPIIVAAGDVRGIRL